MTNYNRFACPNSSCSFYAQFNSEHIKPIDHGLEKIKRFSALDAPVVEKNFLKEKQNGTLKNFRKHA